VKWTIEPGVRARGDGALLKIALRNLLENAWKYTSKRPAAHIEFGAETLADGALACFVRDDGAGFDMRYAGKLFGAFQRLHTASEFDGTGIGLATVRRIVTRHGGRISAEAAVGKGATFRIVLPTLARRPV
jgi:light-regulated signal transduction histidine kinase (bacteriophytochrome)